MNIIQDLFDSVISDSISQGYQFLSFLLIASVIVVALIVLAYGLQCERRHCHQSDCCKN